MNQQQFSPPQFQILPVVTKNLLIICGLFFLADFSLSENIFSIKDHFALHGWHSSLFKPWQILTYGFLHADFSHILGIALGLWFCASVLENIWGPKKFIVFYITCLIACAFATLIVNYFEIKPVVEAFKAATAAEKEEYGFKVQQYINQASIGASGAIYGCMVAFAYMFPNGVMYFYFLIPVKIKWAILLILAYDVIALIINSPSDNINHVGHLAGAAVGFLLVFIWDKQRKRFF